MFQNLSEKLQRLKSLRGQSTITEEDIGEALKEMPHRAARSQRQPRRRQGSRRAHPRQGFKSGGARRLFPTEQVIKIVRDELVAMLGTDAARFKFASQPPTVI